MDFSQAMHEFGDGFTQHYASHVPSADHMAFLMGIGYANNVMYNPYAPEDFLELGLSTYDELLVDRESVPPSIAKKLIKSNYNITSHHIFHSVAEDDIEDILLSSPQGHKICSHPQMSEELMKKAMLMGTSFKENVALNVNATPEILRYIYNSSKSHNMPKVVANPNCPIDIIEENIDTLGVMWMTDNPALTHDVMKSIVDKKLHHEKGKNPFLLECSSVDEEIIRYVYDNDHSEKGMKLVATHPHTPHDIVMELFNSGNMQNKLLAHPNMDRVTIMDFLRSVPQDNYSKAFKIGSGVVNIGSEVVTFQELNRMLSNPQLTIDDLHEISNYDINFNWGMGVLENPHMSHELALDIINGDNFRADSYTAYMLGGLEFPINQPYLSMDIAMAVMDKGSIIGSPILSQVLCNSLN